MSERFVKGDADLSHGVDPQESSEVISDRTYVMYHGTTRRNAESIQVGGFRPSPHGTLGTGVYLSRDHQKASCYPMGHPNCDKVVIKVLVDVGKAIAIRHHNHPLRTTWYRNGYDSAWVPKLPWLGTMEENCIWDPRRIRILQVIKHCELRKPCRSAADGEILKTSD